MGYKNNDRCLERVAVDEPIFILRSKDRLAPMLVRLWADLAKSQLGVCDKVIEAYCIANDMSDWQQKHNSKFPD